jgi:hypothetical protein
VAFRKQRPLVFFHQERFVVESFADRRFNVYTQQLGQWDIFYEKVFQQLFQYYYKWRTVQRKAIKTVTLGVTRLLPGAPVFIHF